MPVFALQKPAQETAPETVELTFDEVYELYQKALAQLVTDFVMAFGEETTRRCIERSQKK